MAFYGSAPTTAYHSTSETILDLYEDSSGTIWAGTGNGLFRLHETDAGVQFEYVNLGEKSNEELEIITIVEDSPGVLRSSVVTQMAKPSDSRQRSRWLPWPFSYPNGR